MIKNKMAKNVKSQIGRLSEDEVKKLVPDIDFEAVTQDIYVLYYQEYDDVRIMEAFRSRNDAQEALEKEYVDDGTFMIEKVELH